MKTSESTKNLNLAMFKFQGIMPRIKRNSKNPHFKSTYVEWDDLVDAVVPYLQQCGLYFEQEVVEADGYIAVSTRIVHAQSDEFKQYEPVRIKETAQGNANHTAGSSITYAKRYSLTLSLALRGTDIDNDGNYDEPPKKQTSTYTKDSSSSYGQKKQYGNSSNWTKNEKSEEKVCSAQQMGLGHKQGELDLARQRKKFFALSNEKGLTDKQMKAIAYFHFEKDSRKELTLSEYVALNAVLESSNRQTIVYMIEKAKAMKMEAM